MNRKKSSLLLLFMSCMMFFAAPAHALVIPDDIFVPMVLRDGSNDPIIVSQDLRVSLWSQSHYKSGDVLGNGSINTAAAHYAGYQTVITITPNGSGYFVPVTFGLYNLYPSQLAGFPEITENNVYVQIEYKDEGAPNTQYVVYDFSGDGSPTTFGRYVLEPQLVNEAVNGGQGTIWESFIIGTNEDGSTDLSLEFGSTLNETLRWVSAQSSFRFSDDLIVDGLLTGSSGATIDGATINFNVNSNNATNINTGTSTGTVTIGGTGTQTIAVGNGAGVKTVNLGSSNTTSTTTISSGTGNINLQAAGTATGNVQIGTGAGAATPDLIVLDTKNTSGDPTGVAGALYYNSSLGKFRCFEAAWFDCLRNSIVSSVVDASITSPTPGTAPTYGTEIELLNPTRPSITPDNTTQRVLITGAVQFTNPSGGDDTNASIRVRVRRGGGSCAGTQVGADITTGFSDPSQSYLLPFFLIDSPATASAQEYTVCAATLDTNGAGGTNAITPNVSIILQQVAP